MPPTTAVYYKTRAAQERKLAAESREKNVAGLHEQLAENYDELAKETGPVAGVQASE